MDKYHIYLYLGFEGLENLSGLLSEFSFLPVDPLSLLDI